MIHCKTVRADRVWYTIVIQTVKSYCSYWFMRMIYWFFALIYMRHQHHHSEWLTCNIDWNHFPCKRMHSNRTQKFSCCICLNRIQSLRSPFEIIAKGNIFHLNNYDVCSVHIVNLCDFHSNTNRIESKRLGCLNPEKA